MKDKDLMTARRALAARLKSESAGVEYAIVSNVDEQLRSCTVTIDGVPFTNVLLYAIENADLKGFVMIPKVDSQVLVSRIGGSNELYVAMFSEVDKVLLTIGDKVSMQITEDNIEVDADKIVFNGGDNKGLIKIQELTAKVNELVDTFNKHVHPGVITAVSGGSGAPAVGTPGNTSAPSAPAQKLNKDDYEDTKITH